MATLLSVPQRKVVLDAWEQTLTEAPFFDRGGACAILGWGVVLQGQCRSFEVGA